MSKVIYYCAATLDGFIAASDDSIDWLTGYEGSYDKPGLEHDPMIQGGAYERFYRGVGALVSGSRTYEWVLRHLPWPYSGKPYWVLSSRNLDLPRGSEQDVRIVNRRPKDIINDVRASAANSDIWIVGGGNVASQFADDGVLDELRLTVVPLVLGNGKPLFDRALSRGSLQLEGTTVFGNGMVELRYST